MKAGFQFFWLSLYGHSSLMWILERVENHFCIIFMSCSLKKNYILNLVNTISTMWFPLITFPYAARIITADGIGQINFFSSIISYISLLTCLGIPMYAIRETARARNNQRELSKSTTEIILLHTCLTLIGICNSLNNCFLVYQRSWLKSHCSFCSVQAFSLQP